MPEEELFNTFPAGLRFYWYEFEQAEEHGKYWGQLCGSMHRLVFVREEFNAISEISDVDGALQRLSYHMENYLVRIYELRERAAKLMKAYARDGDIRKLKGRNTRKEEVIRIVPINPDIAEQYLNLLSALDDDIELRNQNTHDTFLSLGYSNGHDIFDPYDLLNIDLRPQSSEYEEFVEKLKEAVHQTVHCYEEKINQVIRLTEGLLQQLDLEK